MMPRMTPNQANQENAMKNLLSPPQLVILKQVNNGIAVRMAVLALAMAGQRQAGDFKAYN
ncbi:hypothetical protein WDM69_05015 [Moraxella lincolnii]